MESYSYWIDFNTTQLLLDSPAINGLGWRSHLYVNIL